jgi:signal transduction histidine kinase
MSKPDMPENEELRLRKLNEYSLLDTIPEDEYDQITKMASSICGTSISLISLIDKDRQWFKSNIGLGLPETPREFAFCAHAINSPQETFIVSDSRLDERFSQNPYVLNDPNIVFYAGVPLVTEDELALGTLCVIDNKPKTLTDENKEALEILAKQVVKLFELRKKTKDLERAVNDLKIKNQSLEEFARVAAHDIKSPVNNILSLSQFIIEDEKDLSVQGAELISMIGSSATDLGQLIDGILDLSRSSNLLDEEKNWLDLSDFTEGILNMLGVYSKMEVKMDLSSQNIFTNKIALEQIMINIIANSLKYNTSSEPLLAISISEKDNKIEFCIEDNGPGISIKDQERIFTIFQTTDNESRDGISGTGIGLATVKSLVEGLGGTIRVKSQLGMGAAFIFTTEKH